MPIYKVPNYRKISGTKQPWLVKDWSGPQHNAPGEELHEKLAIEPGSKVLFFAGATGDWAHALSRTTEVHYTDASKEMAQFAKGRFGLRGIRSFRTVDAVQWPAKDRYDYVVSFEPYPLSSRLPLIAVRALAHAKGMRIVNPLAYDHYLDRLMWVYKARSSYKEKKITDRHGDEVKVSLWQLDSTPDARTAAQLDLKVIHALQRRGAITMNRLTKLLSRKGITSSKEELESSLRRIDLLARQMKREAPGHDLTSEVEIVA